MYQDQCMEVRRTTFRKEEQRYLSRNNANRATCFHMQHTVSNVTMSFHQGIDYLATAGTVYPNRMQNTLFFETGEQVHLEPYNLINIPLCSVC